MKNVKLNLGCGPTPKEGYMGFDKIDFGQELVGELKDGIKLEDDSVDAIYSSHFVEHLDERELDTLFHEILRLSVKGTIITVSCPHSSQKEAYYLSHLTRWNELRVQGIVDGTNGWSKDKGLKILENKQNGMELNFKLEIC